MAYRTKAVRYALTDIQTDDKHTDEACSLSVGPLIECLMMLNERVFLRV